MWMTSIKAYEKLLYITPKKASALVLTIICNTIAKACTISEWLSKDEGLIKASLMTIVTSYTYVHNNNSNKYVFVI